MATVLDSRFTHRGYNEIVARRVSTFLETPLGATFGEYGCVNS